VLSTVSTNAGFPPSFHRTGRFFNRLSTGHSPPFFHISTKSGEKETKPFHQTSHGF